MIEKLNFEQRFASGRVRSIHVNFVDIELVEPVQGIRLARVMRPHWPPEQDRWLVGDQVERLFIYDLSTEAKQGNAIGHWFASVLWATAARNPWERSHPDHPAIGRVLDGEVAQIAGARDVIVRLGDSLMEGFLNLSEVPDGRIKGVVELLPLGTKLHVKVIDVDAQRCKIELSVLQMLADLERQQGRGPHEVGEPFALTPYLRFAEAGALRHKESASSSRAHPENPWKGCGVLLMDDDKSFSRDLLAWLHEFGAAAWAADNATHAADLLARNGSQITHILLDHSVGARQVRAEMLSLIKRHRKGRLVAIVSGLPEVEAPETAHRLGFGFIPKPIRFEWAHLWLTKGELPSLRLDLLSPAPYWGMQPDARRTSISERGGNWLAEVCRQVNAVAGLWLRCFRPGYAIIARHGVSGLPVDQELEEALPRLGQSLISDVEQDGEPHGQDRHDMGALRGVWPSDAQYALALPLFESQSRVVDDVLLIFGAAKVEIDFGSRQWRHLQAWWLDLLALERAEDRLTEEAAFATQGRVHSATLHELRPLMQAFESPRPWTPEVAVDWWAQGLKAKHLINSGLYNIRPERIAQVNLRDRIRTLMDTFIWQFISRREVTVVVHLPPAGLTAYLPPEVIEQPLVNLVDNATKFCMRRRWARIEVRVFVDKDDVKHPLVIRVSDQGVGMTPEEERHLFRPRHTSSGESGFGMGLYISATLAKAAGGELLLTSNRRWSGTIFELRLPLAWGRQSGGPTP
ncbi:ATP-binding protein [Piscinibacter sp. XHJ-5]|uniref:ATP-binding protein n=1 Tax=Piscinibacter sp. XHJ-5 TaxID=3037797 RepID=UPI002452A61C|nr:ATP-binding protein [Piscinibacter sp. XHJ-5]